MATAPQWSPWLSVGVSINRDVPGAVTPARGCSQSASTHLGESPSPCASPPAASPLEMASRSESRSGESGSGAPSNPRTRTSRAASALSPCSRRTGADTSASWVARMASAASSMATDWNDAIFGVPSARRTRRHPLRKLRSIQLPVRPADRTRLRLTTSRSSGSYAGRSANLGSGMLGRSIGLKNARRARCRKARLSVHDGRGRSPRRRH